MIFIYLQASQIQNLVPGTILILLTGKHAGKRVVYLKALENGQLLVTGPYKLNQVPLTAVAPEFSIATSTKVELPTLSLTKFDAAYFESAVAPAAKTEADFFGDDEPVEVDSEKLEDQKSVDEALVEAIKKTALLQEYLETPFALNEGDKPHAMIF